MATVGILKSSIEKRNHTVNLGHRREDLHIYLIQFEYVLMRGKKIGVLITAFPIAKHIQ